MANAKTVELSIVERLILLGRVMPRKGGSWDEVITADQFRDMLDVSEEEADAIDLQTGGEGSMSFNPDKAAARGRESYRLTEDEVRLVVRGFVQLKQREDGIPMNDPHLSRLTKLFIEDIQAYESDRSDEGE
jgi:hypothetical protein